MSDTHKTIESLTDATLQTLAQSRVSLIFAPNATGKTRLAQHLKERNPDGVALYNSFVEDVFTWDNQRVVLKIDLNSELAALIVSQGLERSIVDTFQAFANTTIEPTIDFVSGDISFGIHTGDDDSSEGIKISRAEESMFVWSVYYSILNEAIDTLRDSPDLRSTPEYDTLTLAVIDDPVSSMDDVRIVSVALALVELIERASNLPLKFVVATHHALFFNVLFNRLRRQRRALKACLLQRESFGGWSLKTQGSDSPFSYHLRIVEDLQSAIARNAIERGHFNQFRALLEKTANFLGYSGGWGALLTGTDATLLTQILNLYSHDHLSDMENPEVHEQYKDALADGFQTFLKTFGWAAAG